MKLIHGLILAVGALAAGIPQLEAAFPPNLTPYMKGAQAVLIVIGAVLGTMDPPVGSKLARRA